jgi:hypothetical protein
MHAFCFATPRATLDDGPRSMDQWIQAILLVPRPLDKGPKTKKWQIEAKPTWHLFWRENQISPNWLLGNWTLDPRVRT